MTKHTGLETRYCATDYSKKEIALVVGHEFVSAWGDRAVEAFDNLRAALPDDYDTVMTVVDLAIYEAIEVGERKRARAIKNLIGG